MYLNTYYLMTVNTWCETLHKVSLAHVILITTLRADNHYLHFIENETGTAEIECDLL